MELETPAEFITRLTQQFEERFAQAQAAMQAESDGRINLMRNEFDARAKMMADHVSVAMASTTNPTAPSPQSKAQLRKPPAFSGSKRENVSDFVFLMQNYLDGTNESHDKWVKVASTYLQGSAASWYRYRNSHLQAIGMGDTWDSFIQGLRETYEPINEQQVARDRLANCRQLYTVNDYNHAFTSIIMRIEDIGDAEKLDRYVRGLNHAIKTEVLMKQPGNLQQAMKIASTFDTLKMHASGRPYMPPNNSYNNYRQPRYSDRPTPMETNAIQDRNSRPRSSSFQNYGQQQHQNRPHVHNLRRPDSFVRVPPRSNTFHPNQGHKPSWGRGNGPPRRRN